VWKLQDTSSEPSFKHSVYKMFSLPFEFCKSLAWTCFVGLPVSLGFAVGRNSFMELRILRVERSGGVGSKSPAAFIRTDFPE
jgi:hypothetical protein